MMRQKRQMQKWLNMMHCWKTRTDVQTAHDLSCAVPLEFDLGRALLQIGAQVVQIIATATRSVQDVIC